MKDQIKIALESGTLTIGSIREAVEPLGYVVIKNLFASPAVVRQETQDDPYNIPLPGTGRVWA